MPFPLAIVESPIYEQRENAERLGPFAIATVAPYSGPVSVIEVV